MKKIGIGILVLTLLLCGCAGAVKDGVKLLEEKNYEEAKKVFSKDIEKKKNLKEAYHGLGIACFELQEYENALEAFELALEHEEEPSAMIYGFMGACCMETEQYEKALEIYKKALGTEDITEELKQEIQFNLIAVHEYMGNWDAAKKQIEQYTKAYPDDTRVEKEADFLETR